MEYKNFLPYVANTFPDNLTDNDDFMAYLNEDKTLESYASKFYMTLPAPRIEYCSSSDFSKIKSDVLGQTNQIVQALGLFPIETQTELLF